MEVYGNAEQLFLENFNVDRLFDTIDKADYLFLCYIKYIGSQAENNGVVYLSELAEKMQLSVPVVSKAVKRMQEQGYVEWKMTLEKDRTYVKLTENAIELMNDERVRLGKIYELLQKEVTEEDMKTTIRTMKKIKELLTSI